MKNRDNKPKIFKNADSEWTIITPNFKRGKCENPQAPNCKNLDKLLWLKSIKRPGPYPVQTLYICAKCAKKDFKLVGLWAETWEKDFKNEPKYEPK